MRAVPSQQSVHYCGRIESPHWVARIPPRINLHQHRWRLNPYSSTASQLGCVPPLTENTYYYTAGLLPFTHGNEINAFLCSVCYTCQLRTLLSHAYGCNAIHSVHSVHAVGFVFIMSIVQCKLRIPQSFQRWLSKGKHSAQCVISASRIECKAHENRKRTPHRHTNIELKKSHCYFFVFFWGHRGERRRSRRGVGEGGFAGVIAVCNCLKKKAINRP